MIVDTDTGEVLIERRIADRRQTAKFNAFNWALYVAIVFAAGFALGHYYR